MTVAMESRKSFDQRTAECAELGHVTVSWKSIPPPHGPRWVCVNCGLSWLTRPHERVWPG